MVDGRKTRSWPTPCGIIRVTALWPLCRYRHKSHWTGHPNRLGRDLKNRFGTAAYAAEELVAELSSAMLGAELGLPVTHLDSHASYIEHWLSICSPRHMVNNREVVVM
jgi:antirestriction protein ArdC